MADLLFAITRTIGRLIPESRFKEHLRKLFYRYIYNLPIGTKNITIKGEEFCVVKTLFGIDNKGEVEQYMKYYTPKKGDVILDAGGFYGIYSLYCARKTGPTGKVVCFEIDPLNLKILKRNLALNPQDNVQLVEKGLWDKKASLGLSFGGAGSSLHNKKSIVKVTLDTGDAIVKALKLKKVSALKMNIEGAELQALPGLRQTLKKHKPTLIIMANHVVDGVVTDKTVVLFLKKLGYKITVTKNKLVFGREKQ